MSLLPDIISPAAAAIEPDKQFISGYWLSDKNSQLRQLETLPEQLRRIDVPFCLVEDKSDVMIALAGSIHFRDGGASDNNHKLLGFASKQEITALGDKQFCQDYGIKYPYMTGSMANGIASVGFVVAIANGGMLASFGAAGLSLAEIENAIKRLKGSLNGKPYCFNLIYSPNEKGHEDAVVDLYLHYGIDLVETSAYMKLTLPVVRYRVTGLHKDSEGNIIAPNRIIAKASRVELASKWFSPPPENLLNELLAQAAITEDEAALAKHIPMAQDLTVEADSGGHTDNRPAITLLPTMLALRDQFQARYNYTHPLRVGAAGGIAIPASALGAFAMGAAYIVTGTVNQACKESGSSDIVRQMLANAEQADVTMAPAVDMFEMGVKLQVLKRGTLFAMRGNKLYDIYKKVGSIEDISESDKTNLEKNIFKMSLDEVWQKTEDFFNGRDPSQVEKANKDAKHKMALIFRWYLGLSSRWANAGVEDRQVDYQVWCGPAMGAFNEWTRDSFLADPDQRDAVTVAMNILFGAAVLSRINGFHKQGVELPVELTQFHPMRLDTIKGYLE
ncbi:MAG: PfaD family polyunsaturated fatty acid/polyketide biosynthesis protein [Proteobacteria bacterium]|nr:PfaD family polyunsaturated fatty acid/polyketide biosynthesis protein [Pseudomonadota bacterium]